jgi:hypothetical protein
VALWLVLVGWPAGAQEATAARPQPRPIDFVVATAAGESGGQLAEAELDELVGPVALYPDSLLAQVLVAATYPLDVIKAERWLSENAALSDGERADAAETQDWDPSIQVLAGAFPDVVRRMAEDIDWTESLGDAVLAETDKVLEAVQRQRARAEAVGNLATNEAQVVETEGDSITIAPADPGVVYVPAYDPATAFAPTYVEPAVVTDTGVSAGDVLMTGAIAFGTAMLVDEIFDDDDDWDDYWYGPPRFDWDDGEFYPDRDVDIEGDVNIDMDRDRVRIDGEPRRIGDAEGAFADRAGAWRPPADRQQQAREKLAARRPTGEHVDGQRKLQAGAGAADTGARAKLEAARARQGPASMPSLNDSALRPKSSDPFHARRASERGAASLDRDRPRASASRAQASARPKAVSKPRQARPAAKRSPPQTTAFKRSSSGSKARAASSRGHRSTGRSGGRSGGGRRR